MPQVISENHPRSVQGHDGAGQEEPALPLNFCAHALF